MQNLYIIVYFGGGGERIEEKYIWKREPYSDL